MYKCSVFNFPVMSVQSRDPIHLEGFQYSSALPIKRFEEGSKLGSCFLGTAYNEQSCLNAMTQIRKNLD